MKPITLEWVNKADGDYAVMEREGRVRKNPSYDGVCFHAQQCAEKYLKAWLTEADIEFTKTHDLAALLNLIVPHKPFLEMLRMDLSYISDFAVAFRYPGESATHEHAKMTIKKCRIVRKVFREAMCLPDL